MSAKQVDIANKALIEMKSINEAMTKETKNTVSMLLSDVVKDALRENIKNKKDYVIIEGKRKASKELDEDEEMPDEAAPEAEGEEAEMPEAPAEEGDETEAPEEGAEEMPEGGEEDMSQYQVDDNTYDLTGEEDYDKVVKVYKLLKDDDQVVIKKDEDGKVNLKDNETGAEYVIDFGEMDEETPMEGEEEEPVEGEGEEMPEEAPAEEGEEEPLMEGLYEIDSEDEDDESDFEEDDDDEFDLDLDAIKDDNDDFDPEEARRARKFAEDDMEDEDWDDKDGFSSHEDLDFDELHDDYDDFDPEEAEMAKKYADEDMEDEDEPAGLMENKRKNKKMMKESKEVIFEVDLGYTDNYQDEDPIKGLSMTEPSKSGKNWDEGVPTGTEKSWSKLKAKQKPFVAEEDEFDAEEDPEENPEGFDDEEETVEEAATSKSKRDKRHATKTRTVGGREYNPQVTKVNVDESLKRIKNENKALKGALSEIKSQLKEAYMTNVNLGKITKLFLENTTTQAEKVNIINRFANEAKTAKQSKTLYESIDRQLKASKKMPQITENKSMTVENNRINENKIYESNDLKEMKSFMKRMMNC